MLTKRDAENVFDRVGNCSVEWEFWHDDGDCNIWVSSDDEWLVQVSHRDNVVVFNHDDPNSDEQVAVLTCYDDDRMGVKMLAAATANPHRLHDRLRDHPATRVISANITVK
jgi:hypothetical protein